MEMMILMVVVRCIGVSSGMDERHVYVCAEGEKKKRGEKTKGEYENETISEKIWCVESNRNKEEENKVSVSVYWNLRDQSRTKCWPIHASRPCRPPWY
jgi:hypothetical protein